MIKVIVADDHPVFRVGLISILKIAKDFNVIDEAVTCREALKKSRNSKQT